MKKKKYKMTKKEWKIYNAIMTTFPATHPDSAYNVAIQGGVKFNFYPK